VRQVCARWGEPEVVRGCAELLRTGPPDEGYLLNLAMSLGELSDRNFFSTGKPPGHGYWARVWAVRALLYVWADEAVSAVVAALQDQHWRVREMAARVVVVRELAQAADALLGDVDDPTPRVRIAVARALAVVGEAEHAHGLQTIRADPEPLVAASGAAALQALSRRLDRAFD